MEQRIRDVAVRSFQQQQQDGRNNPESNGESSSGGGVAREDQAIRWERFLPRKNLRVLLVENDDSTRHIVAALLRKCSYQVAAVADGLKAWKVLKERDYNFDLVLTEVAMPSLSGIGLLSKIMSTEMCKNIPVIMMSSHDSIGIVFKCMLKGAADFLVKPVRKNELRNLWQHVWRKYCASNGGDGLENENSNNNKPEAASDNEAASNNGNSNAGNRSKISFSSEGNDSESSSSRQDMQTESMKRQEEPLQTDYKSTAFKSDSKLEDHEVSMAKAGASLTREKGNTKDNSTDIEIKLALSIHKAVSSENVREKNGSYVRSSYWEDDPDPKRRKNGANIAPNHLDGNDGMHLPSRQIEFIEKRTSGKFTSQVLEDNHDGEYVAQESLKSGDDQSGSVPLWELSLRSQLKCQDKEVFQGKHLLKHSKGSAFSRYVDESSHLVCPRSSSSSSHIKNNECGSSNRQISSNDDNCRNTPLTERATSSHVYGGEASIQRQLSFGTHKEGTEPSSSTPSREDIVGRFPNGTAVSHHLQFGVAPVSIPGAMPFQNWCSGYGTILQPFFQPDPSVSFRGSAEAFREPVAVPSNPYTDNCNQLNNIPQHGNRHFYYGNHHTPQLMQGSEEQRVERIAIVNGSKGIHKDVGVPSNAGVAIETGSERDRSLREAALTKFRLKRKDRCFEKKVRYHNRKKLAEQRPRLKGQFVCQAATKLNSAAAESDD